MSAGAGASTLKRISLEVDAARRLAGEETADRVHAADEAEPDRAQRAIDNEYQPLLDGRSTHALQGGDDELDAPRAVRRLETFVAYGALSWPWLSLLDTFDVCRAV